MTEEGDIPEVDVDELSGRLADGAMMLDVREVGEVEEVRVPGGMHIPLQLVPGRLEEIPVGETFYVICAVGGRSRSAVEFLRDAGFDAVNVAGGTKAWIAAGFRTASGPLEGEAS